MPSSGDIGEDLGKGKLWTEALGGSKGGRWRMLAKQRRKTSKALNCCGQWGNGAFLLVIGMVDSETECWVSGWKCSLGQGFENLTVQSITKIMRRKI